MSWTDDKIEKLKTLWAEGYSCSQIGAQMGITRNAVIGKVHRLQLPGRAQRSRAPYVQPVKKPVDRSRMGNRRKSLIPAVKLPDGAGLRPMHAMKPAPVKPSGPGVILFDLAANGCKFPIGEVDGIRGRHLFCNAERPGHMPYCAYHTDLAARGAPRPWTKTEDEFVLRHWSHGLGLDHIAMTLDRMKAVVTLRARQLLRAA
jgi:GcrA cell cycle regulator